MKDLNKGVFDKNIKTFKKDLLQKNLKFKENTDLYNLFKLSIINNNLLKKDYQILKNLINKTIPNGLIKKYWGEKEIENLRLGLSIYQNIYVIFLDIIGFTKMSEKLSPEKTLKLLNIYFDGIVEILKKYGGFIDKFLGDGIMVIFPENISGDDVLKSCLEIEEYISKLNLLNKEKISVGIGINYGKVIMGTIGSKKRMEITVIGDIINTAAKLEQETRIKKYKILFTKNFYNKLNNTNNLKIDSLGKTKISGKNNEIEIFGIMKNI